MFLCAVFHRLSLLFSLARFYFATAMDATCWGEDWPFSFLVLLAHLGTISCRRTLPDKSLARTLSLRWCFRMCDWTRCSAGFKVFFSCTLVTVSFFFILCDFIHVFIMLQVCIFFHVIYKGLLQSVAHIHFERELCSCSSVVCLLLLDHILLPL